MKKLITFTTLFSAVAMIWLNSCEKNNGPSPNNPCNSSFHFQDTLVLKPGDQLINCHDNVLFKMDSVVSDSRCPGCLSSCEGEDPVVVCSDCFWEGSAKVAFSLTVNGKTTDFDLDTYNDPPTYNREKVIDGYSINLITLFPGPFTCYGTGGRTENDEYGVTVAVTK